MKMIETHGFCDFDHVSFHSGNFNTTYMLGALIVFWEDNFLAGNRYFPFSKHFDVVMTFQAPRNGIHLDT